MTATSAFPLPPNLPRPADDGAAGHLPGLLLPEIALLGTSGRLIDLSKLSAARTVLYCYPMTGVPGRPLPDGWDLIPGARGCTPQTCSFRDVYGEFTQLQTAVFGVSTQTAEYQREMAARLDLPFEILSDWEFKFCDALKLPAFAVEGTRLLKRLTMIIRDGRVEHVLYPVFPPNKSAEQTLDWLRDHPILE